MFMRTGFTYDLQLTVIKFFVIMANSDNTSLLHIGSKFHWKLS